MNAIRLSCPGIDTGPFWIPSFQLRTGDLVCLHIPGPIYYAEEETQIIRILTGKRPGLEQFGRTCWVDPPTCQMGLIGLFYQPRPVTWLRKTARISREQAETITTRLGLRPEWRNCQLGGNPRALLALEAAWALGAETVIFSTSGCDPLGCQALYDAVLSKIHQCPAVHLSHEFWTNGRRMRDCHPKARCIELTRQSDSPASRKSA